MTRIRTYSELETLSTFAERYDYLSLSSTIGAATFGFDRWINQRFYTSREWKSVRDLVIVRDNGCDLGIPGFEIHEQVLVHHINPITAEEITHSNQRIIDPEYLITTCFETHNAIHFGVESKVPRVVVERQPGDTDLW